MIFSDNDKQQIEHAIREAEAHTAGEIVVAEVERSNSYGTQSALAAALVAAMLATVAVFVEPHIPAPIALLSQIPLFGLAWVVFRSAPLQRMLAGPAMMDVATQSRAAQLFAERGVHVTRDRTGVLIMLSELEHRVVILADAGINARLGADAWKAQVAIITSAIHDGRPAEGVVKVVNELAERLREHFPRRPDDTDELPNHVLRER